MLVNGIRRPHIICRWFAGIQQGAEPKQGRILPWNFHNRQWQSFDQRHSRAGETAGSWIARVFKEPELFLDTALNLRLTHYRKTQKFLDSFHFLLLYVCLTVRPESLQRLQGLTPCILWCRWNITTVLGILVAYYVLIAGGNIVELWVFVYN